MKSVLFVCLLLAPCAFAQKANRVELELGSVTVWLTEPQAQVKQVMGAAGMYFGNDTGRGVYLVVDPTANRTYDIRFIDSS